MNNEYYHSSVDIKEYTFPIISLHNYSNDEIKKIIKLKNEFNNAKNKEEKYNLALQLPSELFCKCRFCGKLIVNLNFNIKYDKIKNILHVRNPKIYYREINGIKYYLSCCEDCLLEHFKDDLPKSPKYYFMKANKYGAYSYGYNFEIYKKICSMTTGVTKQVMINKWGQDEGLNRWNNYCNKQSEVNKFEYKKEKYNWDKEQFKLFNKSRAVTLNNLIKKHGDIKGKIIWENYLYLQKYKKSYKYMIDTFGEEKANQINKSKGLTLENYIKRFGESEGLKQFEIAINKHKNYFSKISQKFFNELDEILSKKYTTYYGSKNNEYGVNLNNTYVRLDYFILELNLCIEFNGTYFHGDPRIFNENDNPNPFLKNVTAKELWERDTLRYKELKEIRNIDTIVVWEIDYKNGIDINEFIVNTLKINIC